MALNTFSNNIDDEWSQFISNNYNNIETKITPAPPKYPPPPQSKPPSPPQKTLTIPSNIPSNIPSKYFSIQYS